jgi:hypothetical protein
MKTVSGMTGEILVDLTSMPSGKIVSSMKFAFENK